MSKIDQLREGAEILQQVDVTEIISSLATGIAEAQTKLDNNSIKQAIALADPNNGVGGKSLIELGFMPAFYHFQYADVSAEIDLRMRIKTDFELNVDLYANYSKQGGFTKEKMDFLREDHESKQRKEYKSSKSVATTASNEEELYVDGQAVQMNMTEGSVHRVEDFRNQLLEVNEVDKASVSVDAESVSVSISESSTTIADYINGYIVVTVPEDLTDTEAVLKVTEYGTGNAINISGDDIDITASFTEVRDSLVSTLTTDLLYLLAFDGSTVYKKDGSDYELEVFFETAKDNVVVALDEAQDGKDNPSTKVFLQHLVTILKNDPNCKIKITGYTDGVGSENDNIQLSKDRSISAKEWFNGQGIPDIQIATKWVGESEATDGIEDINFRKVKIEIISNGDYFYMQLPGADTIASMTAYTDALKAGIVWGVDGTATLADTDLFIILDGTTYPIENISSIADFESKFTGSLIADKFSLTKSENTAYLLHNDATLKYTVFSNTKEDYEFTHGSSQSSDFSGEETKYFVDETVSQKTLIKKDAESLNNPSTVAVGGSVNVRVARQFEMEVKGNTKVSARLVSLPSPPEFLDEIKEYFKNN